MHSCCYVEGSEVLNLSDDFYELPYVKQVDLSGFDDLVIDEIHQDHITRLPEGGKILCSSKNTEIEAFTIDNNFLAFQGHPEYNTKFQVGLHWRFYKPEVDNFDEWAQDFMKNKFKQELTQEKIIEIC